jgi:dephospho-CoA kinase
LIDAPIDVRLDRAALRDNADVARIRLRMASQTMMNDISSGMIKAPVDSVILNDGSIEEYQKKLDEFVKNIA